MKKPFMKGLSVLITAVIAIAICFVGLQVNNKRQYDQRVAYAKSAVTAEQNKLKKLQDSVDVLYVSEKKDFLKVEATTTEVSKLKADVEALKATAADFNIKEKALPKEAKNLETQKKALVDELLDISDKLRIQADTDKLFAERLPNWQNSTDDLLVKDDLTAEEVSIVKEKLVFFEENDWRSLADHYLSFAADQVETIAAADKQIKNLLKEETVVTYEDYLAIVEQVKGVKNDKKKAEFEKSVEQIAARIGVAAESDTSSDNDTATEESTTEETTTNIYDDATYGQTNTDTNTNYDNTVNNDVTDDNSADNGAGTVSEESTPVNDSTVSEERSTENDNATE